MGLIALEDKGLDTTREYIKRMGISKFVNLLTFSDNYIHSCYLEPKSSMAVTPWRDMHI